MQKVNGELFSFTTPPRQGLYWVRRGLCVPVPLSQNPMIWDDGTEQREYQRELVVSN